MAARTTAVQQVEAHVMALEERVKVVEDKVQHVEAGLVNEITRATSIDEELRDLLVTLRDKKNPITEFVAENWKFIAVWITITIGGDVEQLVKIFKTLAM